ncbi:hypothetical protein M5E89_10985 [Acidaminococcus intestini]|nr:hypothetical protein M5E89_10985 [Acidaminococcus intestini]
MQQVVIATHNQGKMEEFKVLLEALGLDFAVSMISRISPNRKKQGRLLPPMHA